MSRQVTLAGQAPAGQGAEEATHDKPTWWRDPETGEHFLPIDEDRSWKAYKTAGGDYALTIHSDSAGFGDEVAYFDTLRQAKTHAERNRDVA